MEPRANLGQQDGSEAPLDALKEEVRKAQRKLAYFEHFGTLMEQPISETVRRAVDRDLDYERNVKRLQDEIGELREQLTELDREVAHRSAETERQTANAQQEATRIIRAASEYATRVVHEAIARLEAGVITAESAASSAQVGGSAGVLGTAPPPGADARPWAVAPERLPSPAEPSDPSGQAMPGIQAPATGPAEPAHATVPSPFLTPAEPTPEPVVLRSQTGPERSVTSCAEDEDSIGLNDQTENLLATGRSTPEGRDVSRDAVTRLKVHVEDPAGLDRLVRTLESRLGAGGVAVANSGPGGSDLLVSHSHETSLLGLLLTLDSLEFRPIARSEGFLEIEVRSI